MHFRLQWGIRTLRTYYKRNYGTYSRLMSSVFMYEFHYNIIIDFNSFLYLYRSIRVNIVRRYRYLVLTY